MTPKRFQRRATAVEAVRLSAENIADVAKWIGRGCYFRDRPERPYIAIRDCVKYAYPGDWIVKLGVITFYAYDDGEFQRTYEDAKP